jgi:DNA polymerase (family 10)
MTNQEIADIFLTIARILAMKGENPFKIRAYQRAADTITGAPFSVADCPDRDAVRRLPGIGEAIFNKIKELADTGRLTVYENLLDSDEAELLAFLDIPGMGPKQARMIYETMGINTLDGLKTAAENKQLRTLTGFGPKKEKNILDGIHLALKYKERLPLAHVYPKMRAVVDALRGEPAVLDILIGGSLRRMKETVADADILVASDDPEAVMIAFTGLPAVGKILSRGLTKSSVRLHGDIQVDVRVVPESSFGAAAQYFTGSKAHNVRIRALAAGMGLKVNEYGIFRGQEKIAGQSEEEVYNALGLPLIPPEIREDRGEIEAAQSGCLPDLVSIEDIRGDLHMHSDWSDGHMGIQEMAQAAKNRRYHYIAICDHSPHLGVTNGLDPARLLRQGEEIDRVNGRLDGIRVLKGIEVDILPDGRLDLPDDVLATLDVVVASAHTRFGQTRQEVTRRLITAAAHPLVTIIGHPTGRLIGRREPYDVDMEALMATCRQSGTLLEVNANPERLDLSARHCRMAQSAGVSIAINSDAHRMAELDFMAFGVATARRGWIGSSQVINTLDVKHLLSFIRKSRTGRGSVIEPI